MRTQAGFTLIELITSVVLMGLLAIFAGYFITTGMRGVLGARQAEENGQRAQIALTRIAIELRDVNPATSIVISGNSSITYASTQAALGGVRTLAYSGNAITLTPSAGGTPHILVDGVTSCSITFDNTYSTTFTISFTLANSAAPFSITVKPRTLSTVTVTTS